MKDREVAYLLAVLSRESEGETGAGTHGGGHTGHEGQGGCGQEGEESKDTHG